MSTDQTPLQQSPTAALEIAHVLFMDIVSYSMMPMDQQRARIRTLQQIVSESSEFKRAQASEQLIRLPTGDGMALVFFGDAEAPVRCAIELGHALRSHREIPVRMGVNTGPVYRVDDINANRNVSGGGINMAQRVMDCGDAGHILTSKNVADFLTQITAWRGTLTDLGEAEVKHGVRVHIFNLATAEAGNPKLPQKLRKAAVRKTAKWSAIATAVAIILLAGALAWYFYTGQARIVTGIPRRHSIAVLGFKNLTGHREDDWISDTLAEQLPTELSVGEKVRVVSGEDVARAKSDLAVANMEILGTETLSRFRKRLDCQMVLVGSYINIGGQLRVDLRMQDASSGETVASIAETGTDKEIVELVARAGIDLRQKLGVGEMTPEEAAQAKASRPSNPEAARLYAEAVKHLRQFDALGARDLLERATATDPNYAVAHSALAAAWDQLGYDTKRLAEAKAAFDLSGKLSREERLSIEAQYREANSEWDKAIEIFHSLWTFFPDQLEYGLRLADAQTFAGKGQDALATLKAARALPGPEKDDARIDLKQAEAAVTLSDFKQEQEFASRAANKAKLQGERLLLATAKWRECGGFSNLGDYASAKIAGELARSGYVELGDRLGVARSLTCLGNVFANEGNVSKAKELRLQALQYAEEVGSQRDIAGALNNLGNLLSSTGDMEGAGRDYQRALSITQEIGDKAQVLLAQNNLGTFYVTQAKFQDAQRMFSASKTTAEQIGDTANMALAMMNIASIDGVLGKLDAAQAAIQATVAASRQMGQQSYLAQALVALGDVQTAQGQVDLAGTTYQQAFDLYSRLGEKTGIASVQAAIANLAVELANAPEAEPLARQAAAEFRAEGDSDHEAAAQEVLARSLLLSGKVSEAHTEIEVARKLPVQDRATNWSIDITSARILAHTGATRPALDALEQVRAQADKAKAVSFSLEARLAQAEIQSLRGNPAPVRSTLTSLQRDAARSGYNLVAQKAAQQQKALR